MTTFSAIDRYDAPVASVVLCATTFAISFAACAFGTYFVDDWYANYPNTLELVPDAMSFFWRPVTLIYAFLCFLFTIRIWWFLRTPGAIPTPIIGLPYLASLALPGTVGLWFAGYSVVQARTIEKGDPSGLLVVWGPVGGAALLFVCLVFQRVVVSVLEWWEETF